MEQPFQVVCDLYLSLGYIHQDLRDLHICDLTWRESDQRLASFFLQFLHVHDFIERTDADACV